jgi:hypothetical protein
MRQANSPSKPTQLAKDSPESLPKRPGEGRPKTSKDSKKRKTKTFRPQTSASLILWANDAQEKISTILNPILLDYYNKKNLRSLSNEQYNELEKTKTKILFSLMPDTNITEANVLPLLQHINDKKLNPILASYNNYVQSIKNDLNKELSTDEYRHTKSCFYASVYDHINGE